MKNYLKIFSLVAMTAASLLADDTKVEEIKVPVVKCAEPTISIAPGEFGCTANQCQTANPATLSSNPLILMAMQANGVDTTNYQGLGTSSGNMLMTALKESNCFRIVDLDKYKKMKEKLEATGQKVNPPKIDYFVNFSITSLEISKDGGSLGGGFLSAVPIIGGITKNNQTAKLGVDFSVNDSTLETKLSKAFNATSEKTSWGFALGGLVGTGAAGGGWSVSKNIALDTVVRDVVFTTVNYMAENMLKDKITYRPTPASETKQ